MVGGWEGEGSCLTAIRGIESADNNAVIKFIMAFGLCCLGKPRERRKSISASLICASISQLWNASPILSEGGQNTIAELYISVEIIYMKRVAFRIFALVGYYHNSIR
jgi:hypothetical protein